MNIQRWKGIIWFGSLVVGGALVFYVYDFLQRKDVLAEEISDKQLTSVLDGIEPPDEQKTDVIEYSAVDHVFHKHDWTGKEKAPPPPPPGPGTPVKPPQVPVASLIKVLAIKVDTGKPENSRAYIKYIDQKIALQHTEKGDDILLPGKHLFPPHDGVFVEAITEQGVVFAFDDETREQETVPTSPYLSTLGGELAIVMVGPEGVIRPQVQSQIQQASPDLPPWRPDRLTQVRKNEFVVDQGTLAELDRDYSRILSRDISYSTYKNPRTGVTEGIKINRVAPNSIPAQAGMSEGEVLKSINGHKVTSVNEAVAYVKANVNGTDTWTAVFEKQGREFTRTYHSPR